jgi:hypothetical protein
MKVALCFIINYEHILNKEEIWREWIEPNKDIINVYFYYKDFKKIKSEWIIGNTIPPNYIYDTSYYHVIPAYLSIMSFALSQDPNNSWFCMLTDSCCPIISPKRFRYLFYNYYNKSILNWRAAWWNIEFHKRANLHKLPSELHLANDPWFVLKRENVVQILNYVNNKKEITKTICNGGLANESLFAIILKSYRQLETNGVNRGNIIKAITHITDWTRMTSSTSPHLFKQANETDINFIDLELEKNKYAMFIRKIAPEFPNETIRNYIYQYNKTRDDKLIVREPILFTIIKLKKYLFLCFKYCIPLFILLYLYKYIFCI